MASEEVAGGIVGFLRLDADDFHREITKALAEIKVLSSADAKVHVEATGVRSTERDLLKVATAAKAVDGNVSSMGRSFSSGGMSKGPLIVGGVAAAMALLGPVTGAATAALGGFVGVAGTATLAFVGFRDEIQKGSALGQVLQGQLDGIKTEFKDLGATAASAMSGDVLSGLSEIRRFLPTINPEVEALAGHLGRAFNTSAKGVVSGLQAMMPLLEDGGRYAEVLANKFADFAASQDFRDFVDYARRELPNVGGAIISLAEGITSLGIALAPVGDDLIELIRVSGEAAKAIAPVVSVTSKLARIAAIGANPLQFLAHGLQQSRDSATNATGAIDEHTSHLLTLQSVQSPLAASLGITDQALQDAAKKHRDTAQAAAAATAQMQYENDAAGLLRQELDKLNGKSLSAAQAQNNFDSALANMSDHVTKTGKTITLTTKNLHGMSAASVAIRGDLIRQANTLEDVIVANGGLTNATGKSKAEYKKMYDQIVANATAHGHEKKAVEEFLSTLIDVNDFKVQPTRVEANRKLLADSISQIKAFQTAIDKLHGKSVTASVHYAYTGQLPTGGHSTAGGSTFKDGGQIPGYASGTIVGPGTGTSDSILGMVAQTNRLLRVSAGEFISTNASRQRNAAALEAGNRGATLAVADGSGRVVELGPTSIAAIAAAVSRVKVKTSVSSRDIGAALVVGT